MSQQQDDGFAWSSEEPNQFLVSVCCPITVAVPVQLFEGRLAQIFSWPALLCRAEQ